jgi:cellulose synthase (UDP-forming)
MTIRQNFIQKQNPAISGIPANLSMYSSHETPTLAPGSPGYSPPRSVLFEENPTRRFRIRVIALGAALVGLAYLTWRAFATLNLAAWWLSVPLLLVEIQAFISLLLFTFSLWDLNHLKPARKVSAFEGRVAVLIPTYNEGAEVLLPTVAAALALQPAHETWLLDDGNRLEVANLARALGANYLSRPEPAGARAGNLNYALQHLEADFIAFFAADHVASPYFLTNTLGYFDDPRVALVQTPQDFYNHRSFEHGPDKLKKTLQIEAGLNQRYHEQALFYRVIQAGKNRWNAALWCGTNAVIRLAALKEIGGLAVETLAPDVQTSLRFHRRGWKTVCHNEVLARGLAAATAAQFQLQRHRRATGAMQVLRRENPLFVSGLSLPQRLAYAATLLGWFEAWRTLFYLALPPVILLTAAAPVLADPLPFVAAVMVNYLLQQWAMFRLGRGLYHPLSGTIFELVRMTPTLLATLALFKRGPQRSLVTPKGRTHKQRRRVSTPRPLVAVLAASGLALVVFGMRLGGLRLAPYAVDWLAYGALGWLAFNTGLVGLAVGRVKSKQFASEVRRSVRFLTDFPASLSGLECQVVNASLNGVRLVVPGLAAAPDFADYQPGQVYTLKVELGPVPVSFKVVLKLLKAEPESGGYALGCDFVRGQFSERAALARFIFTRPNLEVSSQ